MGMLGLADIADKLQNDKAQQLKLYRANGFYIYLIEPPRLAFMTFVNTKSGGYSCPQGRTPIDIKRVREDNKRRTESYKQLPRALPLQSSYAGKPVSKTKASCPSANARARANSIFSSRPTMSRSIPRPRTRRPSFSTRPLLVRVSDANGSPDVSLIMSTSENWHRGGTV